MIRKALILLFVATLATAFPTQSSGQGKAADINEADWNAIRLSAERYAKAFNAGDAKTLADLYSSEAELIASSGNELNGRESIAAAYAEFFETYPGASLRVEVESVKLVATTIAIEEGRTETRLAKDAPPILSRYTAVHAKENGRWRLVSVRDTEVDADHGGQLEQLNWLIGRWVDEADDSLVEIDCYWHESGSYLIREFKVRVEGLIATGGTERIGWDPLRGRVRSWLFDDAGGVLEADWIRNGDKWTISAKGFRADGLPTAATYVVTPLKDDAYHVASFNRVAGKQNLDDLDMTIVRKPPPPGSDHENEPDSNTDNEEADQ